MKNWENVKMLADKIEWFEGKYPAYDRAFIEFGEKSEQKEKLAEDEKTVDELIELFGRDVTAAARDLVRIRKDIRLAARNDDIPALLRAVAERTELENK